MALRDQPYLPLYVLDFLVDEKLAYCSAESTGVYIRLMCILHKMPEYGVVTLKEREKKSDDTIRNFADQLSYLMPYQVDVIDRSLRELDFRRGSHSRRGATLSEENGQRRRDKRKAL